MTKIITQHEIVGLKNSELGSIELGSLYPVLDSDNETIIGVYSAEYGQPDGYRLDRELQDYVERLNSSY